MMKINPSGRRAFTLIELLVVISILGILASILLPVLAKADRKAKVAYCINNQHQLAVAWTAHAGDNRDEIVGMGDTTNTDWRIRPGAFTPGPTPVVRTDQDATVQWDQTGYKLGALYPFASHVDIIHCPADVRYRLTSGFAYTSYSGGGGLGTGKSYALRKTTDIRHPSDRFLWIEENDPRTADVSNTLRTFTVGENAGAWDIRSVDTWFPNAPKWPTEMTLWDTPAAFHVSSGTLSFADGHAENHRWQDNATLWIANYQGLDKPTQALRISLASSPTPETDGKGSPRDLPYLFGAFACTYWP